MKDQLERMAAHVLIRLVPLALAPSLGLAHAYLPFFLVEGFGVKYILLIQIVTIHAVGL